MPTQIQMYIKKNEQRNLLLKFPMDSDQLATIKTNELQCPPSIDRTIYNYYIKEPLWLQDALAGNSINLEEINYLAKRMDSFNKEELLTYEAVVEYHDSYDITDMINLTFYSNRYTLITDVSNLANIGLKSHLSANGSIPLTDIDNKYDEFEEMGKELLESGTGTVTMLGLLFPPKYPIMDSPYRTSDVFPAYDYDGSFTIAIDIPLQKEQNTMTHLQKFFSLRAKRN